MWKEYMSHNPDLHHGMIVYYAMNMVSVLISLGISLVVRVPAEPNQALKPTGPHGGPAA